MVSRSLIAVIILFLNISIEFCYIFSYIYVYQQLLYWMKLSLKVDEAASIHLMQSNPKKS